jgi:hypothetical protein
LISLLGKQKPVEGDETNIEMREKEGNDRDNES